MLKSILICSLAGLFYAYEYILRISPNSMVNDLMGFYQISATQLGVLATYYYYAYTPLQLPIGILLDRFGPRKMLTLASLCCTLGSLLFSSNVSLELAKWGRFLIGFGSAFAFVGVLKLSGNWFKPTLFPLAAGIIITFGTLAAMLGNIGMNSLSNFIYWQFTLQFLTLLGCLITPLLWFYISDSNVKNIPLEPPVAPQKTSVLLRELFQFSKSPQVWMNALIGCLIYLPTSLFNELWGHSCLLKLHGLCNNTANSAISMTFLGWAIGAPLMGVIAEKLNKRKFLLQISCIGCFLLFSLLLYSSSLSSFSIHWILFLLGIFSSPQILVLVIAKENCKPESSATMFAFNNFIIMTGALICQPLVGRLLDYFSSTSSAVTSASGTASIIAYHDYGNYLGSHYVMALNIIPLGLVLAFSLSFFLKSK